MKYVDFVELGYEPKKTDVICKFLIDPEGVDINEAAGAVAAESSIGTWTELTTERPYVEKLAARVFSFEQNVARVAYPLELFELGNMPNILSSLAGNVFGLKTLRNLRLDDIEFPDTLLRSFKGPRYGIEGIRKMLKIQDRPLLGTIIKPKLGLRISDHAQVAYEAWTGGCDIVKDDENLSNQEFSPFAARLAKTLESRDKAEQETGERKVYMINVTAETGQMLKRAELVLRQGGEYVMIDILTCGFAALQTFRDSEFELAIHAHRAGHAAVTRNQEHGVSMKVLAKVARAIGVDQLHVGTIVGKMSETRKEVSENCAALKGKMGRLNAVLPVASGGLHPGLVPALMGFFGMDFVIQAGGGIHGHKDGTKAGASAMRQAVDATLGGIPLNEFARKHKELKVAIETWSTPS